IGPGAALHQGAGTGHLHALAAPRSRHEPEVRVSHRRHRLSRQSAHPPVPAARVRGADRGGGGDHADHDRPQLLSWAVLLRHDQGPAAVKIVDVCAFYAPRGGGVRTYVERKLAAGPRFGHEIVIVAPGAEYRT